MRRWTILLCLLVVAWPLHAQTDNAPCEIDLSEVVALMVRAQAQASAGNTSNALRLLDDVQARLNRISAGCSEASAQVRPTPPSDEDAPSQSTITGDTQTYTAPQNRFSVTFPATWTFTGDAASLLAGTNQDVINALTLVDAQLARGERGVAVVVGTPDELAPNVTRSADIDAIIAAYQVTFVNDLGLSIGGAEQINIGDREGRGFRYTTAGYSGLLITAPLEDDLFLLVLAIAPPGDDLDLPGVALRIAQSVQVGGQ